MLVRLYGRMYGNGSRFRPLGKRFQVNAKASASAETERNVSQYHGSGYVRVPRKAMTVWILV